jgi:hypothetical protein
VHAWSNHDFDTARGSLAADVKVTATTTQPVMPDTNLAGIDDYMRGVIQFRPGRRARQRTRDRQRRRRS